MIMMVPGVTGQRLGFYIIMLGGTWTVICKKIKLDPILTIYTGASSKRIKNVNVKKEKLYKYTKI